MKMGESDIKSNTRSTKNINENFIFDTCEIEINHALRSRLNAEGRWFRIDVALREFPAAVTALLKHKRHEWNIYGLANDEKVNYMWTNKGSSSYSVEFSGNLIQMIMMAKRAQCTTIFRIHNHPNLSGVRYAHLAPSDADLESYDILKDIFANSGLSFIDIVCEYDRFMVYGYNFAEKYISRKIGTECMWSESHVFSRMNLLMKKSES